jgi:hypothetical protein
MLAFRYTHVIGITCRNIFEDKTTSNLFAEETGLFAHETSHYNYCTCISYARELRYSMQKYYISYLVNGWFDFNGYVT